MSMSRKLKKKLIAAAAALTVLSAGTAYAGSDRPAGGKVAVGEVEVLHDRMTPQTAVAGMTLRPLEFTGDTIMAMNNSLINWQVFNIGPGSNLTFNTNGKVLVNQVPNNGPVSEIYGGLYQSGAGHLFLINPSGITVGGNGEVIGTGAITLAAVQTLSTAQFNALSAGNAITLTPTGNVTFNNDHASVNNQLNLFGKAVSDGGAHREENDINATESAKFKLENNMLVKDGDTPPTPSPTPDVGPKTEEEAKQFVDQTKGSVDTLTESQRGNDAAVKAAQEAWQNANQGNTSTQNDSSLTGVQDHVYVVQTGAEKNNTGLNTGDLFGGKPVTVSEAAARSRNLAKQYMKALEDGKKDEAEALKQQLKDANDAVKALKEQEKAQSDAAKALAEANTANEQQEQPLSGGTVVQTGADRNNLGNGDAIGDALRALQGAGGQPITVEEATRRYNAVEKEYVEALRSGDKEKTAALREELDKANKELWDAQHAAIKAEIKAEWDKREAAQQAAKEAAIKEAQEKLDKAAEDGKAAVQAVKDAQQKIKDAEAKAEKAALDYLKALQSGDKLAIEAFKAELQKANDALVAAKKEEADAQKAVQDAAYRVSHGMADVRAAENKSYYDVGTSDSASGGAGEQQPVQQAEQQQNAGPGNEDAWNGPGVDAKSASQLLDELRRFTEQQQQQQGQQTVGQGNEGAGTRAGDGETGAKALFDELRRYTEQRSTESQETDAGSVGVTITTVNEPEQESGGSNWIDDIVGERLLTQESNARNKLRSAQTSEERAEAMKELDEIHAEETKLVNEALQKQEQERQAAEQRRNDEQIKAIGGNALQSAIDYAALTKQTADGMMDLLRATNDLYENADQECRKLSEQYWNEREAGASPEKLEEINQKWQELNKVRNELKEAVNEMWKSAKEANQQAEAADAEMKRAQTLAEIGKLETQTALNEKENLESRLAEAMQEKAQADANLEAAKANADAAAKAYDDAVKARTDAQAAADAWGDRYDNEHGGELQAKLDALDQRLESLNNQFNDDSTTPEQADRINEEISRVYAEKERLENAYSSEKEKAFENTPENRSLQEAKERALDAQSAADTKDAEYKAEQADKNVTSLLDKINEKQKEIDNATQTLEDRLDPESAKRRADSDLALARMYEAAAAENLAKVKEENKNNVVTTNALGSVVGGAVDIATQSSEENSIASTFRQYTPEAQAAVDKAQKEYDLAKENTVKAEANKLQASQLSKYNADAELSKLKSQQTQR